MTGRCYRADRQMTSSPIMSRGCDTVIGVDVPDRTASLPWRRTWTGLAVLALVIGGLYATVPYSRGTVVVDGEQVVTVDCASPIVGAWGSDDDASRAVLVRGHLDRRCPSQARERLAIGVVLVLAGAGGLVALRRSDRR